MAGERIIVSPEVLSFIGDGPIDTAGGAGESIMLRFHTGGSGSAFVDLTRCPVAEHDGDAAIVFVVAAAACRRLFPAVAIAAGRWHLPSELRAIALAIRHGSCSPAGKAMRVAKSIELFCGVFAALEADTMVPAAGSDALSELDARRIAAARRIIDERWREKLTLDAIARACGVKRAKLTRGFRETFRCSVADAIAERRLKGARDMLLATDLPVSSVGYACGYLNNASFTRAFSRRFGLAPSQLRQVRAAA